MNRVLTLTQRPVSISRNLLRKLANEGKTILVSSHVLTELQDLCDEIGIMRNGKMIVSGSIEEITQRKQATRKLEIELLEESYKFTEFVEQSPTLSELKQTHERKAQFEISHSGEREEIPEILSKMIANGLKVSSFTTQKSKVEDLFLEIESESSEFDQN